MSKPKITGTAHFRDKGECQTYPGNRLVMVSMVLSVPADHAITQSFEHTCPVTGNDELFHMHLGHREDVSEETDRGATQGVFTKKIWKV